MSKDFYTSDGARYSVNSSGEVYGPQGFAGQIDTFGDFVAAGTGKKYHINNYGTITTNDGSGSGQIYNGNNVVFDEKNSTESNTYTYSGFGGGISWRTKLIAFIIIMLLGFIAQIVMFFKVFIL